MNFRQREKVRTTLKMKKCFYCKSKENLTIDHKTPLSRGGTDDLNNLQCLCESCNKIKSSVRHDEIKRIIKWWLDIKGFKYKNLRPLKENET